MGIQIQKGNSVKLLEENIGDNLRDLQLGNELLDRTPKT